VVNDDPGERWSWRALTWLLAAVIGSLFTIGVGRAVVPRYELHAHFPLYVRLDRHTGEVTVCRLQQLDGPAIDCGDQP
jgi:hypothetical protein